MPAYAQGTDREFPFTRDLWARSDTVTETGNCPFQPFTLDGQTAEAQHAAPVTAIAPYNAAANERLCVPKAVPQVYSGRETLLLPRSSDSLPSQSRTNSPIDGSAFARLQWPAPERTQLALPLAPGAFGDTIVVSVTY
jgi:hypothetical protein